MGFVVSTTPKEGLKSFCKAFGIKNRRNIQISAFFDLKGTGEFHLLDNKLTDPVILMDGSLEEVVYLARLIKKTKVCQVVRFAWPEGSGVILNDKILITSIPSDGYSEMSRTAARDEIMKDEICSEEEADDLLNDRGGAYDNEVEYRDLLQESWQDLAIIHGRCPTKKHLIKDKAFSELFKLGFKINNYKKSDLARLDLRIKSIEGKGPSYKDIGKAKIFLARDAGESTYTHRDRCHNFFKNAPKSFLNNIQYFKELIPITAGFFVEYASDSVRSNIEVGKLAARKINGFPDGYRNLEEPALSDPEVLCVALSSNPHNLTFAPLPIKKKLSKLETLISIDSEDRNSLSEISLGNLLNTDLLDLITAWCVGQLREGRLKAADLVTLHKFVRELQKSGT
jgi:hypothetical protein